VINPRIQLKPEWDEKFSVLVDGEIIFGHKTLAKCNERMSHLDTFLAMEELRQRQESAAKAYVDEVRPL